MFEKRIENLTKIVEDMRKTMETYEMNDRAKSAVLQTIAETEEVIEQMKKADAGAVD